MQPILLPLLLLTGSGRLAAAQAPSAVSSALAGPVSSITGSVTTQLAGSSQTSPIASAASSAESGSVPTPTVASESTASPTSTIAPDAIVGLEPLPAVQSWCLDPIYCSGQDILNTVELAKVFPDSKTFPDKPTRYGLNQTVTAWQALRESNGNVTYSELETFLNDYFVAEGTELVPVSINANFSPSAASYLPNVENELIRAWQTEVISYWASLIRETNTSVLCTSTEDCDSTIIPLNNSVVVPGGRYREVYYWDSYWILQGLLHSGLAEYALDLLTNFMDQLDLYGFIPNGGRKYYLNRSQPPVFTQMVAEYVAFTNDTTILERALPLMDVEFNFWTTNRTLSVTSPYTNTSYDVARYDVFLNTGPRPEGYVEDYETVNLSQPPLNETEAEDLYVQLASGAESGWDYTARWMKEPLKNISDPLQGLRSLNIRSIIPVDLNAILTSNHYRLADLYDQYSLSSSNSSGNSSLSNATARADLHRMQGDKGKEALLDLMWDPVKYSFYDFNMTSNARSDFWALSAFFPYWLDIFPPELQTNPESAAKAFAGLDYILAKYAGSVPASLTASTLNWDFPNAWPPLQYILAEGLDKLNANVTTQTYASLVASATGNGSLWDLIPAGQLGMNETDLPEQPGQAANATSAGIQAHDDYADESTTWRDAIQHAVVQRYTEAAFCSWYSTGGQLEGLLEQLPAAELNLTNSNAQSTGKMFEKFNATDIDAAGGGGEYETPVGFGWTNGVVIFFGAKYGANISMPRCPNIQIEEVSGAGANMTATNVVGGEFVAVGQPKAKYAGSRIPYSS